MNSERKKAVNIGSSKANKGFEFDFVENRK